MHKSSSSRCRTFLRPFSKWDKAQYGLDRLKITFDPGMPLSQSQQLPFAGDIYQVRFVPIAGDLAEL